MRQLRLVGLAEDGDSLVLESPTGESYRLPVDERVRAACRGDLTRLGQIEIETDNPLRPREIQARVRAGESAEEVAASAGMSLDRVLRFAYAVLQERSRVVAQARTMPVRSPAAEHLGDLVEERLVSRGTDAGTLRWDAWRRDDGRWTVRLGWRQGDRAHAAHWSLDLGRRALQPEDPAAEQLSAAEFHARTITAVTPLAVAARAATEPTAPAGPRGRGGPGSGHAQPARRPPAERRAGERAAGERAAGDRAAGDRAAGDRAAGDRAAGDRAAGDRAAGDRAAGDRAAGERAAGERAAGERAAGERAASSRQTARPERAKGERAKSEGRRPREARDEDTDDDGEPAEGRIAAGGGTIPLVEGEEDRSRRATVPSWDDILLGVRRRH